MTVQCCCVCCAVSLASTSKLTSARHAYAACPTQYRLKSIAGYLPPDPSDLRCKRATSYVLASIHSAHYSGYIVLSCQLSRPHPMERCMARSLCQDTPCTHHSQCAPPYPTATSLMFGLTLRRRDPATAVTRKRRNPGAPCISTPPVGVHPELSSCGSGGDGW